MKEYITLSCYTNTTRDPRQFFIINVIRYYKDSNYSIRHREKNLPATLWTNFRFIKEPFEELGYENERLYYKNNRCYTVVKTPKIFR
jgi:hypothetical protein